MPQLGADVKPGQYIYGQQAKDRTGQCAPQVVKKYWRKWVEAVEKELEGWDFNNAVSVVNISEVPKNAKVVPLGELYRKERREV